MLENHQHFEKKRPRSSAANTLIWPVAGGDYSYGVISGTPPLLFLSTGVVPGNRFADLGAWIEANDSLLR